MMLWLFTTLGALCVTWDMLYVTSSLTSSRPIQETAAAGVHSEGTSVASPRAFSEYCELESFQPRCPPDHVIQVTQAMYGLISLGRCMAADFGYVGCFVDVIDYVGGRCSGRRSCKQDVPDRYLSTAATECRPEFKSFLKASYTCLPVDGSASCRSCQTMGRVQLNAAGTDGSGGGYIASIHTSERHDDSGCGGPRCPWVIEAQPGQVINLTLFEFGPPSVHQSTHHGSSSGSRQRPSGGASDPCPGARLAIVKESANPRDFSVCGSVGTGSHVTGKHIFMSVSNRIEVHIISAEILTGKLQFLIRYEAVGCTDISLPANVWSRRMDNKMELGCTNGNRKWTLTCVGTQWSGAVNASCNSPSVTTSSSASWDAFIETLQNWFKTLQDYVDTVPLEILVTGVVSVMVVLFVIILTCCCVCIKRRSYRSRYNRSTVPRSRGNGPPSEVNGPGYFTNDCVDGGKFLYPSPTCKVHGHLVAAGDCVDPASYAAGDNVINQYGGAPSVANPRMDNRPLPSLPRRYGTEAIAGNSVPAPGGSIRSVASGSDASLHWGDTPPRPPPPPPSGGVNAGNGEDIYLQPTPGLIGSDCSGLANAGAGHQPGLPNGAATAAMLMRQQPPRGWRPNDPLLNRASFPVVNTSDVVQPWEMNGNGMMVPHRTMPRPQAAGQSGPGDAVKVGGGGGGKLP